MADQISLLLLEAQSEITAQRERRMTGTFDIIIGLELNEGGIRSAYLETRKRNRPAGARR